jgi:hypothetical protein
MKRQRCVYELGKNERKVSTSIYAGGRLFNVKKVYITSNTPSSVCVYTPRSLYRAKALDPLLPDSRVSRYSLSLANAKQGTLDDIPKIQQNKHQNKAPSKYAVCLALSLAVKVVKSAQKGSRDIDEYPWRESIKKKQKKNERNADIPLCTKQKRANLKPTCT